jgi:hypothetical protein
MSEYHFEHMFFLELPFWGVGERGVPLKCLKEFTNPVSFLRSLGPLEHYPHPGEKKSQDVKA